MIGISETVEINDQVTDAIADILVQGEHSRSDAEEDGYRLSDLGKSQ